MSRLHGRVATGPPQEPSGRSIAASQHRGSAPLPSGRSIAASQHRGIAAAHLFRRGREHAQLGLGGAREIERVARDAKQEAEAQRERPAAEPRPRLRFSRWRLHGGVRRGCPRRGANVRRARLVSRRARVREVSRCMDGLKQASYKSERAGCGGGPHQTPFVRRRSIRPATPAESTPEGQGACVARSRNLAVRGTHFTNIHRLY